MPFPKKSHDPDGDLNSLKYHKQILKQLLRDATLTGNRKFLAELILMWLSSTGEKREIFKTLILGVNFTKFIDGRGFNINDNKDELENVKKDLQEQDAEKNVLDAINAIERGEDAAV